jgi:DNA-binding NtrC family response regulator
MKEPLTSLLIVDDDASMVTWLEEELRDADYAVHGVTSAKEALSVLDEAPYDVVVSDVVMPEMRGPALLREILTRRPSQPVILMTAFGTIELAVESVRAGASDFIAKPFLIEALRLSIERILREQQLRKEIGRLRGRLTDDAASGFIARSEAMQRVLSKARRAATADLPVLICGESGVGKTALARFIHAASERSRAAFVELNCASIPFNLVEAELFGVRRGAFTDARESRPGLFEAAHQGTLFLDELGELGIDVQPKLLHAIETGRVREVGGTKEKECSVRLIAATNRPLEQALREGRFRADLYHRVNVLRIDIPPLRERPEDVEVLIDVLLERASGRVGREPVGLSRTARRFLLSQAWPGNVRELTNAIERAVALSEHDLLLVEDFEVSSARASRTLAEQVMDAEMTLAQLERLYLKRVLQKTRGNKTMAAQLLGLERRTVYRKVAELGLDDDHEGEP